MVEVESSFRSSPDFPHNALASDPLYQALTSDLQSDDLSVEETLEIYQAQYRRYLELYTSENPEQLIEQAWRNLFE